MSKTNRVVRLKQRPTGAVTAGDFAILEEPLAGAEETARSGSASPMSRSIRRCAAGSHEGRSYVEPVERSAMSCARFAAGHVEAVAPSQIPPSAMR